MKKIFFICFTLLASTLFFCACHSESMDNIVNMKGELKLSTLKVGVDTDVDVVYLDSRAESGVDLSNYIVTIYDKYSQQAGQWTYSEMPEVVSLSVGTYTVEVKSAAEPANGFEAPYYEGTVTCEVKENEVTDVPTISCKLANMMFTIEYEEAFKNKMSDDVVTTLSIGENSLQIPATETRAAYLIAPEDETASLVVNLTGTIDGEAIDYSEHIDNVKSGVHNVIKYQFVPVSDGTESSENTGVVAGGALKISIALDSSMIGSDETVNVYPGTEPGINDFPTGNEGGEVGENAISITGKILGDKSFDIDLPQTVTEQTSLIVGIETQSGIQNLKVKISSNNEDFNGIGTALGEFDLAHSDTMLDDTKDMLTELGLPLDANVLNKTVLDFDISSFTSLLLKFEGEHTFQITVTDNQGNQLSKSLVINIPKK